MDFGWCSRENGQLRNGYWNRPKRAYKKFVFYWDLKTIFGLPLSWIKERRFCVSSLRFYLCYRPIYTHRSLFTWISTNLPIYLPISQPTNQATSLTQSNAASRFDASLTDGSKLPTYNWVMSNCRVSCLWIRFTVTTTFHTLSHLFPIPFPTFSHLPFYHVTPVAGCNLLTANNEDRLTLVLWKRPIQGEQIHLSMLYSTYYLQVRKSIAFGDPPRASTGYFSI